mmetsp:Transcript_7545/g.18487  ORF Transcript_7545/g.18487 Transcript_7545/m.18487 type:complete len:89 (+) Transcript_7545:1921-2187(+)
MNQKMMHQMVMMFRDILDNSMLMAPDHKKYFLSDHKAKKVNRGQFLASAVMYQGMFLIIACFASQCHCCRRIEMGMLGMSESGPPDLR